MKPSLGRIVHYRVSEPSAAFNGHDVHPAMITHVHTETCVNLTVFPDMHPPFCAGSVPYSETEPRAWFWPPRE